ncbi:MAG: DUF3341 domain-containing protein [Pseudomonadota bacterium]
MPAETHIIGLFTDENRAAETIRRLKARSDWRITGVHSPIPSHKIAAALSAKKSLIGWITLCGGVAGFFIGFLLAAFTASRWGLIVSGKPVVALVPFFIVGFECTILFAVLANVMGLIAFARLPDYRGMDHYDPRCSGEHYGIVATCGAEGKIDLTAFFQENGAQTREVPDAR